MTSGFLKTTAITFVLLAATPTFAQEDECGAIITTLNQFGEEVMKQDPKTPPALCAAMGQVLGLAKSAREIADQCLEEGAQRDKAMNDMGEMAKLMQAEIDKTCK